MNNCFIRNGFLAGILIGIGCIANVVSNNVILGSFLFSLALLSICILQLKLCTWSVCGIYYRGWDNCGE